MSSAEPNEDQTPESLQSHLSFGLHAFAQPLAILRAKLFLESFGRMDEAALRTLAEDSATQVERLCNLFNYLQEIVLADAATPQLEDFPVHEAVENAIDSVEVWFQDSGLSLIQSPEDPSQQVHGDKKKLAQAISSVFLLVHGLSSPGESVDVTTESNESVTAIIVGNRQAVVEHLSAERRLALALIETIVRKQGGSFRYSVEPLQFYVHVPRAPITT